MLSQLIEKIQLIESGIHMDFNITDFLNNSFIIIAGQIIAIALILIQEKYLVIPKIKSKINSFKNLIIKSSLITLLYYFVLLLTGKIAFTTIICLVVFLILFLVNNAKYQSLKEPLLFSDYDYFTDAFRFPRLYFPFLGLWGILGIIGGSILVIIGYVKDPLIVDIFNYDQGLLLLIFFTVSSVILLSSTKNISNQISYVANSDYKQLGFILFIWTYFLGYLKKPNVESVFEFANLSKQEAREIDNEDNIFDSLKSSSNPQLQNSKQKKLPHLIAIQSESFFDPRSWNQNIKNEVLENFDLICNNSRQYGCLSVPAWGANTIRTEFSFLTGIAPSQMEAHKFSPYQIMSRKSFKLESFVNLLKNKGYYTVCIHPYYKKFYHRNIIFKKWGFDEFIDIQSFSEANNVGAYIGDQFISQKIQQILLRKLEQPIFIFAITMENHGPMHLERIDENDRFTFIHKRSEETTTYDSSTIKQNNNFSKNDTNDHSDVNSNSENLYDHDLSVYLKHLHNSDLMLKSTIHTLSNINYPISLIFYGDHVPILAKAYRAFGEPNGMVPYFIWDNNAMKKSLYQKPEESCLSSNNEASNKVTNKNLLVEHLAGVWLFGNSYKRKISEKI